ncbi:ankyrin repeat domain-containing protein [Cerasicoccus frondis]|uniref:ankyrin repeat domain-containing protein n=1 Tax=Cerasicoccus frondis TaxID=490090 RepID=UPI002852C035|nr:ankyrin repeat domain-containing protein [Cerasicoccus frondis]
MAWPLWAKILSVVAVIFLLVAIVRNADQSGYGPYDYDEFDEYYEELEASMPFIMALQMGDQELIKEILHDKPELLENATPSFDGLGPQSQQGALFCAMLYGNADSISAVLDAGADVNHRNDDGRTALHLAASQNKPLIVKLLVTHGADVNAQDAVGFTPLFDAAQTGAISAGKALLEAGANPNVTTSDGQSPASIAKEFQQPRFSALLSQFLATAPKQ